MRVLVDGYNLARPHGTGVATYGRTLVSALQSLGHDVGIIYGAESRTAVIELEGPEVLLRQFPSPIGPARRLRRIVGGALTPLGFSMHRLHKCEKAVVDDDAFPGNCELWNTAGLYANAIGGFRKLGVWSKIRSEGHKIAHWTYPLPIRVEGAINIYTLHDLIPLLNPELTLDKGSQYLELVKNIAHRADHIITISDSSKIDIIRNLNIPENKITNCSLAHQVDEDVIQNAAANSHEAIRSLTGLIEDEYFIFFGAIEPKKNIARLLEAYFSCYRKRALVLVGGHGWKVEEELMPLTVRKGTPPAERVIMLGYQPREVLLSLVYGARATLFPSLDEGFGLPAIESMALGTPVMASTRGGLGEVATGAGLIVDPIDVGAMATAISLLDQDDGLVAELSRLGKERASQYTLSRFRDRLSDLYSQLEVSSLP